MRLSECRPGEGGRITKVSGGGPSVQRLMEMGVVEGADVRVVGVAPLGDPIEVTLHNFLLSLRRSEADNVEVAP
jgi:ferrous iron transport protein A